MALGYYELLTGTAISDDQSYSYPTLWQLPIDGGVQIKQVFLKSDHLVPDETFANVWITSEDQLIPSNADWFGFAPDIAGVAGTYVPKLEVGSIDFGQVIPIWIKLTLPPLSYGTLSNIRITLIYTSNL